MIEILKRIDQKFLLETVDRPSFKKLFFANAKDAEIVQYLKDILHL